MSQENQKDMYDKLYDFLLQAMSIWFEISMFVNNYVKELIEKSTNDLNFYTFFKIKFQKSVMQMNNKKPNVTIRTANQNNLNLKYVENRKIN